MSKNDKKPKKVLINKKHVKKNKLKTLNNLLCVINEEIKMIKSFNESGDNSPEQKRKAIENINIISSSFEKLERI